MKKVLLCALLLCLALTACGGGGEEEAGGGDPGPEALARAVLDSQEDAGGLEPLEGDALSAHLNEACGLEDWTSGAVYAASGMDAREIAVVCFESEEAARTGAEALEAYRLDREAAFFGYAPEEADLLERAAVVRSGRYAALLACQDPAAAEAAFEDGLAGEAAEVLGEASPAPEEPTPAPATEPEETEAAPPQETEPATEPEETEVVPPRETEEVPEGTAPAGETQGPPLPPETEPAVNADLDISGFPPFDPPNEAEMEIYDTSAILTAWETGEEDGLSDKDEEILARCREILEEIVTDEMSDFEKELAVHDWIVENGEYDDTVYSNASRSGRVGYRDPYGILVKGYGNCLGYASSFQLLMDLCGVECITVVGAAFDSRSDHAWNMVRLDGEWYCVDVVWDDSLADPENAPPSTVARYRYRYFNVTSDRMRETDHQWDYLHVPEATATYYHWDGTSPLPQPREGTESGAA